MTKREAYNQTYTILAYTEAPWDSDIRTNPQHIMSRIAGFMSVLYIEPPISIFAAIRRKGWLKKWFTGKRYFSPNLALFSPGVLFPRNSSNTFLFNMFTFLNEILIRLQLRLIAHRTRKKYKLIHWIFYPTYTQVIPVNKSEILIYHIVDRYYAIPCHKAKRTYLEHGDQQLTKLSDIVFVTATELYNRKLGINQNIHYTGNAADISIFQDYLKKKHEVPEDIKHLSRPIIGYAGVIDDHKIDSAVIKKIARKMKWISIVFIGPIHADSQDLMEVGKEFENVYFLGYKPYHEIPGYIDSFDVCLLPYRLNEYTECVFPLKLFEYFAMGKPVISTQLASIKQYQNMIDICSTSEEFTECLKMHLSHPDSNHYAEKIRLASENSWDKRVEQLWDIVRNHIDEKK